VANYLRTAPHPYMSFLNLPETKFLESLEDSALFAIVADAGSLSAASRSSGISVARLSRRLIAMETAIGLKLIERGSRRFSLTDHGRDYLAGIAQPLRAMEESFDRGRMQTKVPHGTLRLSASADFGASFLSPLIAEFASLHPQMSFQIDLNPRQIDLVAENFDAAIRVGPLVDSDLTSRRFATVPAYLYASPDYLARHGTPSHPSELSDRQCLPLPHLHGVARFHKGTEEVEAVMRGPFEVNNLVMLRRLCGEGAGIAVLNALVAADGQDHCPIERIMDDWQLEPTVFYFLTSSRLLPARTRAFFDFARGRLAAKGY
jgi:DNA-binding transcriptional LysR family regulator